jgi:threonine/homoserine/homoserine lactone efflux protein
MTTMPWAFVPIALVLTLTPGPATALVVRHALRGGTAAAFRTVVGNAAGVAGWALLSALGVAALVAVSEAAFLTLKVAGVAVLVWLGVQALRGVRRETEPPGGGQIVGEAFLTSAANPKLAVFFVALFPTFIPAGEPVLPRALAMAALVIAFDFVWYLSLAAVVSRAGRVVTGTRFARRLEQATGVVLLGLAGRLALERR